MLHKISFTLSLLLLSLYPSVITLPSCLDGAGGWQIRIATTRVSLRGYWNYRVFIPCVITCRNPPSTSPSCIPCLKASSACRHRFRYKYEGEPFGIRRKDFHPLHLARKLITKFIPSLSHEADGLILQVSVGCTQWVKWVHPHVCLFLVTQCHPGPLSPQPADDPYKALTCHELLKWKFAHLNSVDFKLCYVPKEEGGVSPPSDGTSIWYTSLIS